MVHFAQCLIKELHKRLASGWMDVGRDKKEHEQSVLFLLVTNTYLLRRFNLSSSSADSDKRYSGHGAHSFDDDKQELACKFFRSLSSAS